MNSCYFSESYLAIIMQKCVKFTLNYFNEMGLESCFMPVKLNFIVGV